MADVNKNNMLNFIKRYNLSGIVESVIWKISDNKINTKFILDDATLLGSVTLNEFNYNDCELGIYETSKLIKIMSVLDDSFSFDVGDNINKPNKIIMVDDNITAKYMLCNPELINSKIPKVVDLGDPTIKIKIDSNFINKFSKAKSSLDKCNMFYIHADELTEECEVVLSDGAYDPTSNQSNVDSTNLISIKVETEKIGDLDKLYVNTSIFKDILDYNKDFDECEFLVYKKGLLYLSFNSDLYSSEYYLVGQKSEV